MFHSQWQKKDASWKDLDRRCSARRKDPFTWVCYKTRRRTELNGLIPLTGPFARIQIIPLGRKQEWSIYRWIVPVESDSASALIYSKRALASERRASISHSRISTWNQTKPRSERPPFSHIRAVVIEMPSIQTRDDARFTRRLGNGVLIVLHSRCCCRRIFEKRQEALLDLDPCQ